MGKKYRRYKNALERWLASNKGKRFFNIFYSCGASIVIVGALFKINHWKFGTEILVVGMVTEAIIFLISAFDLPAREYKWDRVFPGLNRKNEEDENEDTSLQPEIIAAQASQIRPAVMSTARPSSRSMSNSASEPNTATTNAPNGNASTVSASGGTLISGNINVVEGVESIDVTEVKEASEKYAEQLTKMTSNLENFATVTESLTKVSDTLLNSFKSVTENSDGIGLNTQGYVTQMENLNRNIAGLNTIYEIQLKGVSGQINTIEQINAGLDRIRNLYAGSLVDSSVFKAETEKMAKQLADLNQVYSRLLQAMTTNMNMNLGGGFYNNNNPQDNK